MTTITAAMLEDARACRDQVELFRSTFGESARITLTNCRKAVDVGLDLDWAAACLLQAPASAAYKTATASAWAAYEAATAPASAAYKTATASAFYHAATGR